MDRELTTYEMGQSINAGIAAVVKRFRISEFEAVELIAAKCPKAYPVFNRACTQAENRFRKTKKG